MQFSFIESRIISSNLSYHRFYLEDWVLCLLNPPHPNSPIRHDGSRGTTHYLGPQRFLENVNQYNLFTYAHFFFLRDLQSNTFYEWENLEVSLLLVLFTCFAAIAINMPVIGTWSASHQTQWKTIVENVSIMQWVITHVVSKCKRVGRIDKIN